MLILIIMIIILGNTHNQNTHYRNKNYHTHMIQIILRLINWIMTLIRIILKLNNRHNHLHHKLFETINNHNHSGLGVGWKWAFTLKVQWPKIKARWKSAKINSEKVLNKQKDSDHRNEKHKMRSIHRFTPFHHLALRGCGREGGMDVQSTPHFTLSPAGPSFPLRPESSLSIKILPRAFTCHLILAFLAVKF